MKINMKNINKVPIAIFLVIFLFSFIFPKEISAAGPMTIDLLSTSNFSILAKTGITNTGSHSSFITGNIGSSPITAAAMDNIFCSEINGSIYGVDVAYTGSGTITCFLGDISAKNLVDNAILDMGAMYVDAAGRTLPDAIDLFVGNIGGQNFTPGLYKWNTDVLISSDVTLSGGQNDTWIFQIVGDLNIASGGSVPTGVKVLLVGGANASNVFWQVGGATGATLGTYSTFNGNILSAKQIIMQTGAVFSGRALADTQVTLDANTVSIPTTLHVIKKVINSSGGVATSSDFIVYVKKFGINVLGSPSLGLDDPGTSYVLSPGTYTISEDSNPLYLISFSGSCDSGGNVTLFLGDNKTCIITNTDVPVVVPVVEPISPPSGRSGGHRRQEVEDIEVIPINILNTNNTTTAPVLIPNFPSTGFPAALYIVIPKIDIETFVEHVGLADNGEMDTPKDSDNAGWFNLGVAIGQEGTSVLAGHFNSNDGDRAVFGRLHELIKGDKLYMVDENYKVLTFVVKNSLIYKEDDDPTDVFISNDGKSHLNLITCAGNWLANKKTYSERRIIFADKEY